MRHAVIADIHGNLEALNAVIKDIDAENINYIYSLGDIVGYYCNPNECINIVKERAVKSIMGNHDYAALGKIDIKESFTYYACVSMEWTQKNLTEESKSYLASLPLTDVVGDDILLTHSGPYKPEKWDYVFIDSEEIIENAFSVFSQKICFYGHTHHPVIMTSQNDKIILFRDRKIKLVGNQHYLVNAGSVGQPRDFDPKACYAIYDDTAQEINIKRVEYDYRSTQTKMKDICLPEYLSHRLSQGT